MSEGHAVSVGPGCQRRSAGSTEVGASGRVGAVSQRARSAGKRRPRVVPAAPSLDFCAMRGPVALVGAGEFLPAMLDFDRVLLEATGRARPRVVILPTASYPDGEDVFPRWAAMGVAHFASLGAEVEPVLVRDRRDAADPAACQAIGEADLIYLSGGKPAHAARRARRLAGRAGAPRRQRPRGGARRLLRRGDGAGRAQLLASAFGSLPWPLRWRPGSASCRARRSCRTTTRGRSRSPR